MISVWRSATVCTMTMVNDTTKTLAERLVLARRLAGLDQAEIAETLGVARTTVSTWERGLTEPSATNFVLWAEITGQPLEWLAGAIVRPKGLEPLTFWFVAADRPLCLACGNAIGSPSDSCSCSCHDAWGSIDEELAFWGIVEQLREVTA